MFPQATNVFNSVKDFNDYLLCPSQPSAAQTFPERAYLTDVFSIVFTHADLHPSNVIVSNTKPAQILAIVDWEQSGWFPGYWEYAKIINTRQNIVTEWVGKQCAGRICNVNPEVPPGDKYYNNALALADFSAK